MPVTSSHHEFRKWVRRHYRVLLVSISTVGVIISVFAVVNQWRTAQSFENRVREERDAANQKANEAIRAADLRALKAEDDAKRRIDKAEAEANHRVITSFAFGVSSLKTTALTLESDALASRLQLKSLAVYKENPCEIPKELFAIKDMPKYDPITKTLNQIQVKMEAMDAADRK